MNSHRPIVLAILDGWGLGKPGPHNAISLAHTPHMTEWMKKYPNTHLSAYGAAVGLAGTTTGNSEVGHLNIGAGYTVPQYEVEISSAIADGSFFTNKVLRQACDAAKQLGVAMHVVTLVGPGQVHSSIEHLWAMLGLAQQSKVERVYVHIFSDGRDASPTWMGKNAESVQKKVQKYGAHVASVCGRYFGMDRDKRWDRTEQTYRLLTERKGLRAADLATAVTHSYDQQHTDEFIEPTVIGNGMAIQNNDVVVILNYRSDRIRQLTQAFVEPGFAGFKRAVELPDVQLFTLTQYQPDLPVSGVAFLPHDVQKPLAKVLSDAGISQLHAAESEKYAHVTYFLNGGREEAFPLEERLLVASPKVATYDLKPEMSAKELTDQVISAIASKKFPVILMNYANPDMVAHTGNLSATIKAIEVVDECLGKLNQALGEQDGILIITADHGNAEVLKSVDGGVDTQHNAGQVPFVVVGKGLPGELKPGVLANVAPTILELLAMQPPLEMTAESLWVK